MNANMINKTYNKIKTSKGKHICKIKDLETSKLKTVKLKNWKCLKYMNVIENNFESRSDS